MNRPAVLVARAVFPQTLARLRQHFEVDDNPADAIFGADELAARLAGKARSEEHTSELQSH